MTLSYDIIVYKHDWLYGSLSHVSHGPSATCDLIPVLTLQRDICVLWHLHVIFPGFHISSFNVEPGEHDGKPFAKMEWYVHVRDAILNKDVSRIGKSFYKTKETVMDILPKYPECAKSQP